MRLTEFHYSDVFGGASSGAADEAVRLNAPLLMKTAILTKYRNTALKKQKTNIRPLSKSSPSWGTDVIKAKATITSGAWTSNFSSGPFPYQGYTSENRPIANQIEKKVSTSIPIRAESPAQALSVEAIAVSIRSESATKVSCIEAITVLDTTGPVSDGKACYSACKRMWGVRNESCG